MFIRLDKFETWSTGPIVFTCPHCGNGGAFQPIGMSDAAINSRSYFFGCRSCPNPSCKAIIFFYGNGSQYSIFPPARIGFNTDDVPHIIVENLTEAITCHANNCYIASGMMIRKTLEAICDDKQAIGANLHQKIESLAKIIVIPNELIAAMKTLKLLGNDAAHIISKDFEVIGIDEITISIEFTKEIIKAVYQYTGLLNKLNSLRKTQ